MTERIRVLAGQPTDEELAALVVALVAVSSSSGDGAPAGPPAWQRAARLEALGAAPVASAADLRGSAETP